MKNYLFAPPLILSLFLILNACSTDDLSRTLDDTEAASLNVLTYNAYLLTADPTGKASLEMRLAKLSGELEATNADVILMQELWSGDAKDKLTVAMKARGYTAYTKEKKSWWPPYFYGNGLCIFVRNTLSVISSPENIVFDDMLNFDKFTNKGALRLTVSAPSFGTVDVVSAHASYLKFDHDTNSYDTANEPTMIKQAKQISSFLAAGPGQIKIMGADMNTHPEKWSPDASAYQSGSKSGIYRHFTETAGLKDTMKEGPSPACEPDCFTWDNGNKLIKQGIFTGSRAEPDARLDYIFYRGADIAVGSSDLAMRKEFTFNINGTNKIMPLSDHYAVMTKFKKSQQ